MVEERLSACRPEDVAAAIDALDGRPHTVAAHEWPDDLRGLHEAGVYSWWVDGAGAGDLSHGLDVSVAAGRIYAGQAGATRWPSITHSTATLGGRINSQHLGGNIHGSTFRLTLASCLASALELTPTGLKHLAPGDERRLSIWIRKHLSVAIHPFLNREALEDLEHHVRDRLDPPLNLKGMMPSPVRGSLRQARKRLLSSPASPARRGKDEARQSAEAPVEADLGGGRVTLHGEIEDIVRKRDSR
jgi:hypothetical protein